MLRRNIDLPSFEGVSAGSVATLSVPAQGTYYQIDLEYREAGILANRSDLQDAISEVRLLINGQIVRRHSAKEIIDLCAHYGVPFTDGYLHLFFWEPWGANAFTQEFFAWGMADVRSFTIEVEFTSGATSPSLKATCKRTLELRNLGVIRKFRKFTVNVGGTGITNYQTLPVSDSYKAIHCFDSGTIDDAEVMVNGSQVFKKTADGMAAALASSPKLTRVVNYYHIDFDEVMRLDDYLPMNNYVLADGQLRADGAVSDFQINFNMNTASSFGILTETIGLVVA